MYPPRVVDRPAYGIFSNKRDRVARHSCQETRERRIGFELPTVLYGDIVEDGFIVYR